VFIYPATELFRGEDRRVVWSLQEFETALEDGWSEDRPEVGEEAPAPRKIARK